MDLRAPLASCFLVALLAAPPLAGVASAQSLSAQEEANARFQTGLKYYDNRDFESARLAFKQAHAVLQKPSILLNLALSELYSNHPLDAIEHFEAYMRDTSTPSDKRERARKHLDEAMKKTAHLQIRTSAEAQITVDNRSVPPPYTMVHVMPGPHSVEARVGAKTKTANINPKPGDTIPLDLTIEGEPAAPVEPPPSASPANPANPANPTEQTSPTNPPSPSTTAPTEPPPAAASEKPSAARIIVPVALGAAAIGGLVVGVVFASEKHASLDEAEAIRSAGSSDVCADGGSARCQAYASQLDDAATQGTISTIGYVASGALAAAAVATFVFWPRASTKTTSLVVTPLLGRAPGASATVHF